MELNFSASGRHGRRRSRGFADVTRTILGTKSQSCRLRAQTGPRRPTSHVWPVNRMRRAWGRKHRLRCIRANSARWKRLSTNNADTIESLGGPCSVCRRHVRRAGSRPPPRHRRHRDRDTTFRWHKGSGPTYRSDPARGQACLYRGNQVTARSRLKPSRGDRRKRRVMRSTGDDLTGHILQFHPAYPQALKELRGSRARSAACSRINAQPVQSRAPCDARKMRCGGTGSLHTMFSMTASGLVGRGRRNHIDARDGGGASALTGDRRLR